MKRQTKSSIKLLPYSNKQLKALSFWTHPKYKDKNFLICDGSIRSGKTVSMIDSFISWSMAEFRNSNFIVAAASMGAMERNVLSVMFDILNTKGIKYEYSLSDQRVYIGTNTYHCFGAPNEKSQDVLQGFTAAGFYADEVAILPQSFVKQAIGRCINTEGFKCFFNCNPESPFHWLKEEYIDKVQERGDILYLTFFLEDNPSMTPAKIEIAKKQFSGVFYRRNIEAQWCLAEGLVYPGFTDDMIVDELPQMRAYYVGIDFGTQNATVYLLCGYGVDGKLYAISEFYHSGRDGVQKSPSQYSDLYKTWIAKCNVNPLFIYYDPSAIGFARQLMVDGVVNLTHAKNDVLPGIQLVSSVISSDKLRVHRSCTNVIKEFSTYSWDPKCQQRGEDAPLKTADHTMDSLRYIIFSQKTDWLLRISSQKKVDK